MRRAGSGAVVQMSSVGGQITAPGFGAYCATKFALEGLTQTLSQEADLGVTFLIVEPGAFRTGLFNPGVAYTSAPMPEYAATVGPACDRRARRPPAVVRQASCQAFPGRTGDGPSRGGSWRAGRRPRSKASR
jgi:NAD(P)-dependent dehydrogenase (short-subunit alcohol dehydrogenase family)